jgi:KaiC/GvpD/RAD55 family RecA-like ATPase
MSALGGDETEEDLFPNKLSTGIDILDNPEYLKGGFKKGSVVTLIADPISTAELFMYDIASMRPTNYFTTSRSEEAVRSNLEIMERSPEEFDVIDVFSADEVFRTVVEGLEDVGREENIIIDTVSDLARHDRFDDILDTVYRVSHETNSVTYLYMIKENSETMDYVESRIPYLSDVVMKVTTGLEGEKIENRLAISKLRGQTPPEKTIKLIIGEEITVDTSRDIA